MNILRMKNRFHRIALHKYRWCGWMVKQIKRYRIHLLSNWKFWIQHEIICYQRLQWLYLAIWPRPFTRMRKIVDYLSAFFRRVDKRILSLSVILPPILFLLTIILNEMTALIQSASYSNMQVGMPYLLSHFLLPISY